MVQNWKYTNESKHLHQTDFWQRCHDHSIKKQLSLQQMVLGHLGNYMKRIQFWTPASLHILTKNKTKPWINHLNIRAKGIELLEENIGVNLSDFSLGNGFLDGYQKHKQQKKKIEKSDFTEMKNISPFKDNINYKMEENTCKSILANQKILARKYLQIYLQLRFLLISRIVRTLTIQRQIIHLKNGQRIY